jgi:hypothetical protein
MLIQIYPISGSRLFSDAESKNDICFEPKSIFWQLGAVFDPKKGIFAVFFRREVAPL